MTTTDAVARALLEPKGLKVVVAVCTQVAREARQRHHLASVSAALMGQGLVGGVLLASLQKGDSRLNLQLEVDGALRGLFVDASAAGAVRGYVKNPDLDVELAEGPFRWRAALGNQGFLSVLRDVEGDYYRSSVELTHLDLALDLNHYFATSDQVPTRVAIEVQRRGEEALGVVAGVLVQRLPDGDLPALEALGATLQADLARTLGGLADPSAEALLEALFAGRPELGLARLEGLPVQWRCQCSKERVLEAIGALGAAQVRDILEQQGSAAVTCQFCATRHELSGADLTQLLARLEGPRA